ncbi:hypothetical protein BD309DRAFT_625803 [Dichomitus squalens]|nr:hypothetical protein BD309DRAFT_625803 [Dichomitus squalens]
MTLLYLTRHHIGEGVLCCELSPDTWLLVAGSSESWIRSWSEGRDAERDAERFPEKFDTRRSVVSPISHRYAFWLNEVQSCHSARFETGAGSQCSS